MHMFGKKGVRVCAIKHSVYCLQKTVILDVVGSMLHHTAPCRPPPRGLSSLRPTTNGNLTQAKALTPQLLEQCRTVAAHSSN